MQQKPVLLTLLGQEGKTEKFYKIPSYMNCWEEQLRIWSVTANHDIWTLKLEVNIKHEMG